MKIEEKIKLLREEKGYSQEYMATQLELTSSAYGKIERGITELTVSKATKIANILNVSLTKILNLEDVTNLNTQTNNGLQSVHTSNPIINQFNKEVLDKLILSKEENVVFLKNQLIQKDDLIKDLMKKFK